MLAESITQNLPISQCPELNLKTYKKAPSNYFKVDLQSAWVEFIERFQPYTWFVTLTFKESKHPEQADRAFYRWIWDINESLYGRRYREHNKGVTWIKCIEYQKRDVLHFHVLVGSPMLYKLKRLDYMKVWETGGKGGDIIINGFARILKFDAHRGAVLYCSKYVLKGGEIDVYISPEQWHLLNDDEPMLNLKFTN